MNKILRLINKIPFAGKIATRHLSLMAYQATSPANRWWSFLGLMATLALMTWGHIDQVKIGLKAIGFTPIWAQAFFVLYTMANLCAVLAQIHLGLRTFCFCLNAPYPKVKRQNIGYSKKQRALMFIFTFGFQAVMVVIYFCYHQKA